MIRKTDNKQIREHAHGGKGHIEVYEILSVAELRNKIRLYARVVIPPGAEIGLHPHKGETESYYILSGKGVFTDGDGKEYPVSSGNICDIREGESHGIRNTGVDPIVMIALVLPE